MTFLPSWYTRAQNLSILSEHASQGLGIDGVMETSHEDFALAVLCNVNVRKL